MKTASTIQDVRNFLSIIQIDANLATVTAMAEGHTSQVFRFQTNDGQSYVFRIRTSEKDLLADQYAYDHFSAILLVPTFVKLGPFDVNSYYCITKYIEGDVVSILRDAEFQRHIPIIWQALAKTFQLDIAATSGYGAVNVANGNAQHATWKNALKNELKDLNEDKLRQSARRLKLPDEMVDQFVKQFNDNLAFVSETRWLLHGDPGGDNMLVKNGKVVALFDWEQMAYGDWLRDFSRFGFWEKNYGDPREFADEFNLEAENIQERIAVYWAIDALRNIEFADVHKDKKVADWLRAHAESKLI